MAIQRNESKTNISVKYSRVSNDDGNNISSLSEPIAVVRRDANYTKRLYLRKPRIPTATVSYAAAGLCIVSVLMFSVGAMCTSLVFAERYGLRVIRVFAQGSANSSSSQQQAQLLGRS
jgi:hypothetical protein